MQLRLVQRLTVGNSIQILRFATVYKTGLRYKTSHFTSVDKKIQNRHVALNGFCLLIFLSFFLPHEYSTVLSRTHKEKKEKKKTF